MNPFVRLSPGATARGQRRAWGIRVLVLIIISVVLLAVMSVLASRSLATLNSDAAWETHTQNVQSVLGKVLQLLTDLETAKRGFALSADPEFLTPYTAAVPLLEPETRVLQQLIVDNPDQRPLATRLDEQAHACLAHTEHVIERIRAGDLEGARALVVSGEGKRLMDGARASVVRMQAEEARLLVRRRAASERARRRTALAFWGTSGLALLLLVGSVYATRRDGARLLRAEEALGTTLRSIGDAVISTDSTGTIQFMNAVAERLTGWAQGEALGKALDHVFRIVNEETREIVESPVAKVLREGTVVGLANHTVLLARDGSERAIEDSGAPIIGDRGVIEGVVLAFRDATEERAAARVLKATQEQFVALAEAMPQLVWVTDPEGNNEYVNRNWAAYTGLNIEEAKREIAWGILHPKDFERTKARWARSLTTGEPYEIEFRLRRHDGAYRWFLARASADRDTEGRVRRWYGTCTDVDATKRTEESLRATEAALLEADVRKDVFLATLSHELRNPLAPIRTAARLLESPALKAEEFERARAIITRQVGHMAALLDDLLDVSRITRGALVLKKQYVELHSMLEAAVETARPLLEAKQHHFTLETPSESVTLEVDPVRLTQIVANLLTNAAKYTDPTGQITLGWRSEVDRLVIFVRDNGIGLAPEMLPKVFEMFSQAETNHTRSEGGLGIGLALVKGLVELHGGSVDARSPGRGRGSEFAIYLPRTLVTPVKPRALANSDPTDLSIRAAHRRVLIADDNSDGAESLALVLQLRGHEVHLARTGPDALTIAAERRPEVLILDIGMPGLNGYEVAKRIRREAWGAQTTLIAVTGWGREEDKQLARASGFDYHLTKPVDPLDLERLLEQTIEPHGKSLARVSTPRPQES